MTAVKWRQYSAMEVLVGEGAHPDFVSSDDFTPLKFAAACGDCTALNIMLYGTARPTHCDVTSGPKSKLTQTRQRTRAGAAPVSLTTGTGSGTVRSTTRGGVGSTRSTRSTRGGGVKAGAKRSRSGGPRYEALIAAATAASTSGSPPPASPTCWVNGNDTGIDSTWLHFGTGMDSAAGARGGNGSLDDAAPLTVGASSVATGSVSSSSSKRTAGGRGPYKVKSVTVSSLNPLAGLDAQHASVNAVSSSGEVTAAGTGTASTSCPGETCPGATEYCSPSGSSSSRGEVSSLTPLMWAILGGHTDAAVLLHGAGASLTVVGGKVSAPSPRNCQMPSNFAVVL